MNTHESTYLCTVSGRRYRLVGLRGSGPGRYRQYEDGEPEPREIAERDAARDIQWQCKVGSAA